MLGRALCGSTRPSNPITRTALTLINCCNFASQAPGRFAMDQPHRRGSRRSAVESFWTDRRRSSHRTASKPPAANRAACRCSSRSPIIDVIEVVARLAGGKPAGARDGRPAENLNGCRTKAAYADIRIIGMFYCPLVTDEENQTRSRCFPSSFTVVACAPLSPASSANVTREPTSNRENPSSRTLFR